MEIKIKREVAQRAGYKAFVPFGVSEKSWESWREEHHIDLSRLSPKKLDDLEALMERFSKVRAVLFVLQNAWRKGAKPGERDDRNARAWERLLWRSQTGKRLREMIPDGIEYEVVNASPFVGSRSLAAFAADCMLMHSRMQRIKPSLVVLCGKVAQELVPVVEGYETPYILAPHPAWRRLSKAETTRIREEITQTRPKPKAAKP